MDGRIAIIPPKWVVVLNPRARITITGHGFLPYPHVFRLLPGSSSRLSPSACCLFFPLDGKQTVGVNKDQVIGAIRADLSDPVTSLIRLTSARTRSPYRGFD